MAPARDAADVSRLTELVRAAYTHYAERLVVLGADDEGFFVDNVAVGASHQGTGVGKALLQHTESAARNDGFDPIHLYTHELMAENLALYSRIGYVEYDRRLHGGAHIVHLRKSLRGEPCDGSYRSGESPFMRRR